VSNDTKTLFRAMRAIPTLRQYQWKMACMILAVQGLDVALEFLEKMKEANMAKPVEIDGETCWEYDLSEIVPIPAKCTKCKRNWTGKDAIRAPSLKICRCFYCDGELIPHPAFPPVIDAETRRKMDGVGQMRLM
jgi:predicted Zn-ribbon and HTH transcriptional regulator